MVHLTRASERLVDAKSSRDPQTSARSGKGGTPLVTRFAKIAETFEQGVNSMIEKSSGVLSHTTTSLKDCLSSTRIRDTGEPSSETQACTGFQFIA